MAGAWAALALVPPTAGAETVVSGDRDSNAPLVIDPSASPIDPLTRETTTVGLETVLFIQRMPVTKTISSVTIGDLGLGSGCVSGRASAQIWEHEGGAWGGSTNERFYATGKAPLPASPGKVTWSFPATTLLEGHAYSFRVAASEGCSTFEQTTWAHNQPQVDGGPSWCEQGPSDRRMWHVHGMDDATWACVTRPLSSRTFEPDMPGGWLVSHSPASNWDIMAGSYHNETPPTAGTCATSAAHNPAVLGAIWVYWRARPDLPEDYSEFVCRWTQFGPPGVELQDGWYYALPWLTARDGAPRDMYLKLETIDYDALLEEYAPVLKFDSESEYWNASPQTITDWSQNELKFDSQSGGCAAFDTFAHGGNEWGIETLIGPGTTYPGTQCYAGESDNVDANGDDKVAADSYLNGPLDNKVYGRVVHDSTGALWLQYWLFYYYNTMSLLGQGAHQGDWEMVQYRIGPGNVPDVATYAQHADDDAESCSWDKVEKHQILVGGVVVREAPVAYVAAESQASYFVAGDHHRGGGLPDDPADGQGELRNTVPGLVSVAGPPAWALWPGQWGEDGASPRSPGLQETKWEHPLSFDQGAGVCSNPDGTPR